MGRNSALLVERLEPRRLCAAASDPAPVAWFRADEVTIPAGSSVASWADSSAHHTDAIQSTASRRPHFSPDGLNGRPSLHFNAASATQLSFARPVSNDFTIVVAFGSSDGVGRDSSWYHGAGLVDGDVAGVTNDFGLSLNSFGQVLAGTGGPDTFVSSGLGFDDGRAHVATFTRAATTGTISLYVDGRLFQRATAGTQPLTAPPRLTIGSAQTNTNYFTGDIGEIRVYDAAVSDTTRAAIEAEVAASYNVAPPAAGWFSNPVINRDFPDPGAVYADGSYYAFATNGNGRNVQAARSTDFVNWTTLPDALPTLPSWAQAGRTWAPDVAVTANGRYNLYYAAWSQVTGRQAIGVATSTNPAGPFAPVGAAPLVSQSDKGGAIDPSVFTDASGTQYLLWKNDGNAVGQDTTIYIERLTADGLGFVGAAAPLIHQDQPWEGSVVEGPVMSQRNGKYYLFYCASDFHSSAYSIGYAVSDSLLGPYVKPAAPLVVSTSSVVGPGGPEIVVGPDGNTWMLYHSWENGFAYRSMSADLLEWDGNTPVLRGPSRASQPMPFRPSVVGRHVFYNNSAFDGYTPAANGRDDAAVATDKEALLPGDPASAANVTNYSRGINGIMIDVTALPQSLDGLSPSSVQIQVGQGGSSPLWTAGPAPSSVTVRRGAGFNGSDQIELVWPDLAIRNEWVRVTVPSGAATGLATPDVIAFGNLVGDTGNAPFGATARVDAFDLLPLRGPRRTAIAGVTSPLDFNHDGRIDARDYAIARANYFRSLAMLVLA